MAGSRLAQDPFFAVKEEVEHSITVVNQLFEKWQELRSDQKKADECEWTSSELLSGLRSIEWDLQDLEDTVSIVESSREKFQVDDEEVQANAAFSAPTFQLLYSPSDPAESEGLYPFDPSAYQWYERRRGGETDRGDRVLNEEPCHDKGIAWECKI